MIYNFSAKNISREINFKKLEKEQIPYKLIAARRPFFAYEIKKNETIAFVFSFGIIVFVNFTDEEEKSLRSALTGYLVEPTSRHVSDTYRLEEGEKEDLGLEGATMKNVNYSDIEITARILAQSVELDYFEGLLRDTVRRLTVAQRELRKKAKLLIGSNKEFIQIVALSNTIIGAVINELSLLDRPDVAWESQHHHQFYLKMANIFDTEDRFHSLEYKITHTRESAQFIIDLMQARRSDRLEIIIIALFVLDIVLALTGNL
jgi:uncharacterized Rmd1/YagE family protein